MNYRTYLTNEISKLIVPAKYPKYWLRYHLIKTKRFLPQTLVIFLLQFTTIIHLPFPSTGLAMYPPIGIAFVVFYFIGNNALLGIFLGSFCGYLLKELSLASMLLYLLADIGGGYLGALLCKNIFSRDIRIFFNAQEIVKFITINAFITCLLASAVRLAAHVIDHKISFAAKNMVFTYLNLWLADLNSILVVAIFLLSWVYVPFSREKISSKPIKKILIILLIGFISLSMLFMQNSALIYLIVPAILASIYLAWLYGYLVATLLLFVNASIYMTYFIIPAHKYALYLHEDLYLLVPTILLLFVLGIFYLAHYTLKKENIT